MQSWSVGAQNVQKSSASFLWAAVATALFCARDTHEATPQMPDSRQSFAAETVDAESALSSDVQSEASCVSHSTGSLHFVFDDAATPQKSFAASGAGSELQPPTERRRKRDGTEEKNGAERARHVREIHTDIRSTPYFLLLPLPLPPREPEPKSLSNESEVALLGAGFLPWGLVIGAGILLGAS